MKKSINGIDKYNTNEFETKIKEIFKKIQNAWNTNNADELLHLESSMLYEKDAEKMRMYASKNIKEVRKDVVINFVDVIEKYEIANKEILKVKLKASMERYVQDVATGEIIEGIKEYKETKIYFLFFVRMIGKEGYTIAKCNGCGADVNIIASGKCEYCGTLFYAKEYDWVVADIEEYPEDKANN